jgi:hypothetical protein
MQNFLALPDFPQSDSDSEEQEEDKNETKVAEVTKELSEVKI